MKLIKLTCPDCGATMEISQDRKVYFCTYCGAKILVDNESKTIKHIIIDESKNSEIELEKLKYLNEIEKRKERSKLFAIASIFLILAIIVTFIAFSILHSDFNVTFNYCLLIIGFAIPCCLVGAKSSPMGLIVLSIIHISSSIAFIIMRNDFNATFTMLLAINILSLLVAEGFVSISKQSE